MNARRLLTFAMSVALLLCGATMASAAVKKTIHVVPESAKITVDGAVVGTGTYQVQFDRHTDYFTIKVEAPGYITQRYKLQKNNPQKTITYTLAPNEALMNTVGYNAESGSVELDGEGVANKWFDVTCRKGLTEEQVWKRLMNVAINNFEEIEVRDKGAGWIRTNWKTTRFPSQQVRTRLEIRMSFGEDDEITYRARIESEIKGNGYSDNVFTKFPFVLKKYEDVIHEITTSLGSNL